MTIDCSFEGLLFGTCYSETILLPFFDTMLFIVGDISATASIVVYFINFLLEGTYAFNAFICSNFVFISV